MSYHFSTRDFSVYFAEDGTLTLAEPGETVSVLLTREEAGKLSIALGQFYWGGTQHWVDGFSGPGGSETPY